MTERPTPPWPEGIGDDEPPMRLRRLMEPRWLAGVCAGIAYRFGMSVTVVRVVMGTLAALGAGVLLYGLCVLCIRPQHRLPKDYVERAHDDRFHEKRRGRRRNR